MNILEDQSLLDEVGFVDFISQIEPQQITFSITKIKRVGDVVPDFQNPRINFIKVKELLSSLIVNGYDVTKPVELGVLTPQVFGSLERIQIVLIDGETRMRAIFAMLVQNVFLKKSKERDSLKDFLGLTLLPTTDQIIQAINLVFDKGKLLEHLKSLLPTSFIINGYLTTINTPSQIYERMLTSNKLTTPFCHWALSRMAETLLYQKVNVPEKIKRLFASEADVGEKRLSSLKEQGVLFNLLEGHYHHELSEQDAKHIVTFFRENNYTKDKKIELLKNLTGLALGNETDRTIFKILVLSPYMNRGRLFKEDIIRKAKLFLTTYGLKKDISGISSVKSVTTAFKEPKCEEVPKKREFDFLKEWLKLIKEVKGGFKQLEEKFSVKFVALNHYEQNKRFICFVQYNIFSNQRVNFDNSNNLSRIDKWISLNDFPYFMNKWVCLTERLIILLKLNPSTIKFSKDPYAFLDLGEI